MRVRIRSSCSAGPARTTMTTGTHPRIAIIGGGNMGGSILSGLLDGGTPADELLLIDPDEPKRARFGARGVMVLPNADARLGGAKLVLLAVKPQITEQVVAGLRDFLTERQLIVSIVAGVSNQAIARMLGGQPPIIRCMPNVPALHRAGVTGLFANDQVSKQQSCLAEDTLAVVGETQWFDDEAMIDVVTAVSGSGPAYFFYLMEVMQGKAEQLGMSRDAARRLVANAAYGAALMVQRSDTEFADLRRMVTSPKGTTEAAITAFDQAGAREALAQGIQRSLQRAKELGEEFNGTNQGVTR